MLWNSTFFTETCSHVISVNTGEWGLHVFKRCSSSEVYTEAFLEYITLIEGKRKENVIARPRPYGPRYQPGMLIISLMDYCVCFVLVFCFFRKLNSRWVGSHRLHTCVFGLVLFRLCFISFLIWTVSLSRVILPLRHFSPRDCLSILSCESWMV